jgi:hypothetical protein
MAKEIEEQPTTLKNCIKEYIDNINNDINIYNFPWDLKKNFFYYINWLWNCVSFLFNGKILV